MKSKKSKSIALFLVFILLAHSGSLFAKERRGADLEITRLDGQTVQGELIAVKESSLLLLLNKTPWDSLGSDLSVNLNEIKIIRIKKKSGAFPGTILGFLIGGGLGAYWGANCPDVGGFKLALIFGLVTGAIGAWGVSMMGGAVSSGYKEIIQIGEKSDSELVEILEKLRSMARVRDYN